MQKKSLLLVHHLKISDLNSKFKCIDRLLLFLLDCWNQPSSQMLLLSFPWHFTSASVPVCSNCKKDQALPTAITHNLK